MVLEQAPFRRYHEKKQVDCFSVRLNVEERDRLDKCKLIIEQTKDSTTLKSLAWIGAKVIQDPSTEYILQVLFKNKRKNKRSGIVDFD